VLELGCSEGVFTAEFARHSPASRVVAIDISQAALTRAQRRCIPHANVIFKRADAFGALPEGPFDLVICSELLYYGGFRVRLLVERIADIATPGARVLLLHPANQASALHRPFVEHAAFEQLSMIHVEDEHRAYDLLTVRRR
jgi:SAM-dependent methyltransferase